MGNVFLALKFNMLKGEEKNHPDTRKTLLIYMWKLL